MPLKQIIFLKILFGGGWLVAAALSRKLSVTLSLVLVLRQMTVITTLRHILGKVKTGPISVIVFIVVMFL